MTLMFPISIFQCSLHEYIIDESSDKHGLQRWLMVRFTRPNITRIFSRNKLGQVHNEWEYKYLKLVTMKSRRKIELWMDGWCKGYIKWQRYQCGGNVNACHKCDLVKNENEWTNLTRPWWASPLFIGPLKLSGPVAPDDCIHLCDTPVSGYVFLSYNCLIEVMILWPILDNSSVIKVLINPSRFSFWRNNIATWLVNASVISITAVKILNLLFLSRINVEHAFNFRVLYTGSAKNCYRF